MSAADVNDDFTDGLLSDFLDESTGLVGRLNENLQQLDQWAKAEHSANERPMDLLNEMFRSAHSIKGLSGMLRLSEINVLTHKVENVFDAARNGELPVSEECVEVVIHAIDCLSAMIDALKDPDAGGVDADRVLSRIEGLLQRFDSAKALGSQADVDPSLFVSAKTTTVAIPEEPAPASAETTDKPRASKPLDQLATNPLAGIVDDADIPPKYLSIFVDEAGITLEELSESLLSPCDAGSVEQLLCGCHRIKGSAASIGLQRAARVAHYMEDRLQDLRRRRIGPDAQDVDLLLKGVDALRGYVAGLSTGAPDTTALGEVCKLLIDGAKRLSEAPVKAASAPTPIDWKPAVVKAAPSDGSGVIGVVRFEAGLPLADLKARLVIERLQSFGRLFYCAPSEAQLDECPVIEQLVFGVATTSDAAVISGTLRVEGVTEIETTVVSEQVREATTTVATTASSVAAPSVEAEIAAKIEAPSSEGAKAAETKAKPTETLRVDIERLDQLMNLSGQLVINRARFSQIGDRLKGVSSLRTTMHSLSAAQHCATRLAVGLQEGEKGGRNTWEMLQGISAKLHDDLEALQRDLQQLQQVRGLIGDLHEAVHQLERVSDGIQNTVMDTRMVPIGPLFARFKRAVRDLTRDNQKDIRLDILGENTELDKRMIDELGDPLIHLVRNSADHGIESPEARVAAGKPRQGTITLNAYHRGNRIVIEVKDDGKGLDAEKIRAKGLSRGLITEADVEKMSLQQIYELIWKPGFSTAEKITEVSGRGMGMDIVLSKIEQLSGTVELSSEPGRGTTFLIKLPLTMAILPSLLAVIDGDVYAVPVESVVEIVRIGRDDISSVHGRPAMRVRGRVISLIHLTDIFGEESRRPENCDDATTTVVIIGVGESELALVVDDLLGEQDVVIQSLAENFQNVQGIAGASILGDGRVSLILDVGTMLEMACRRPKSELEQLQIAN
jgi:two-component system chemotaxis sensor kinase CheA